MMREIYTARPVQIKKGDKHMEHNKNTFGKFPMFIKSISPGLVFVYEECPYLQTTERNCAVNISTGELKRFAPDLVVTVTEFEYSY